MEYAIIRIGNKQHRVRDGETLVVERVKTDEGKSFEPDVLLGGTVIATVVAHERGPKIRIGKYKRRTGYRRHTGYRSATSRVQITLGSASKRAASRKEPAQAEPSAQAGTGAAPGGYAEMTIAEIKAAASTWSRDQVEAALAYEQANQARKGAIAALEGALKED